MHSYGSLLPFPAVVPFAGPGLCRTTNPVGGWGLGVPVRLLVIVMLLCGACSEDSDGAAGGRGNGDPGGSGDALSGGSDGMNYGNSDTMTGSGGSFATDGGGLTGPGLEHCSPGVYRGTYACDLTSDGMAAGVLEGFVQFDLAIDEATTSQECPPDQEFCFDLVIPEGSGTLFGFVGFLIGFETQLEGGLDCRNGIFMASAVDGVWGLPVSSDPSDPNAPATVADPPSGTFDGTLAGVHNGVQPEKIEGSWDLTEPTYNYNCNGPFTVELIP